MNLVEMQTYVNQVIDGRGIENNLVSVQPATFTVAGAVGVTSEPLDIDFFFLRIKGRLAAGIIYVNQDILSNFTDDEVKFILAHECAHILNNHLILKTAWIALENILKGENGENYQTIERLKFLLALLSKEGIPPNAVTLRDQEYEADALAVMITGNLNAAISTLTKLSGGDLTTASHTWELFDKDVPAMTLDQRIAELKRRYSSSLFPKIL